MSQKIQNPLDWIMGGKYRVLYHILFWMVMYLDETFSLVGITEPLESPLEDVFYIAMDMLLVYFNLYILIPQLLLKNKVWRYIGATTLSILIMSLINFYTFFDAEFWEGENLITGIILSVFIPTATLLGTAVAVKLCKFFLQNRSKIESLENDKLKTELAYLKDQINPHFLFNALNNVYVLTRKRPAEASESVLLLSDLLRYQLYDCAKDKMYLTEEIDYIKNFLSLDEFRKTKTDVQFEVTGNTDGKMVAPFIFQPFVENALKYGISADGNGYVKITLEAKNTGIHFIVKNSKANVVKDPTIGGIGLVNVKRRLELLYPQKHTLQIEDGANEFIIDLKMDL